MNLIKIPRNIFQTSDKKNMSESWKHKNLNYAYFLYNNDERDKFIKTHFDFNVFDTYCKIVSNTVKTDLWTYCVLYIYGGVYVETNTNCMNSIDLFLNEDIEFMTVKKTHTLLNTFIASTPKNKILLNCINSIIQPSNYKETNIFTDNYLIPNNAIHLLNIEDNTSFVKDRLNNILFFHNKNELPTIITMFYDIRTKEESKSSVVKKLDRYFDLAKNFILKLPYNLIIFTDNQSCIDLVNKERENRKEQTCICRISFEQLYFYKHIDKLNELQKTFKIYNSFLEKETPRYIVLTNNKFDFIETAINLNPFNSNHFIWMDFGINHVAKNTELINEWIYNIPDKVKQMCINPYIENVNPKKYFEYTYHNIAAGVFSGSKEYLLKYVELFKQKTEEIYNDNWYQLEEAVMTIIHRENPHMFELYYGDFQGIISNYLSPIHNLNLILKSSQKCINYGNTKQCYEMLSYSLTYFKNNLDSELIFDFISQHIIVDYHYNNKLLLPEIIELIKIKKSSTNQSHREKISNLLSNIKLYDNINEI
jgi:hypothetical protein